MSTDSEPRPGWRALDDTEYDAAWTRFYAKFHFKASTKSSGWPSINEPTPSVTFDLSVIPEGPKLPSAIAAINSEALRCFVWALPDHKELLVLDWQHAARWFNPAAEALTIKPQNPLRGHPTIFPNGDYYSFLSPDQNEGTFGHPWEQTLCIIGERLINTLGRSLALWLPVLRINGEPVL